MAEMNFAAVLLALAAVSIEAATVVGQNERCCLPRRIEVTEEIMESNGKTGVMTSRVFIAWDQDKQKVFTNATRIEDGKVATQIGLDDYPNNTRYVVQNGKCMKSTLGPWVDICLPQGVIYLESGYFGHPGKINGVAFNTYWVGGSGAMYISVTQGQTCLPVMISYSVSSYEPYMVTAAFVNSTTTINNPHIFDVPSICKGVDKTAKPQIQPLSVPFLFH